MPTLFAEVAVRAALVAAATALILWALRIRTAALRHAAWTTVVVVMLLLPIWSIAGPSLRLAALNLDGSDSALTPLAGPSFIVHSNWAGNQLTVTHVGAYMTITQRLSFEDGQLKVVNDTAVGYPMVTFTYARQ